MKLKRFSTKTQQFLKKLSKYKFLLLSVLLVAISALLFIPSYRYRLQLLLPNGPEDSDADPIEVEPVDQEYTLLFGGDIMLAREVGQAIVYRGSDPFKNIKDTLISADLAVANLEVVVSNLGSPTPGKLYTFEANPITLNTLTSAGFDAMSVANNHAGDYGRNAFLDMLARLDRVGIGYFGGGANEQKAYSPLYIKLDQLDIALLGFNTIETPYFQAIGDSAGHAWFNEDKMLPAITAAQENADLVIVMPHWGWEYTSQVNPDQKSWGRKMIDAGADIVVGGHPHHIQGTEEYKDKKIFYSLGNFVFDGPGPNAAWSEGEMLEVIVKMEDGVTVIKSLKLLPYHVDDLGVVSWK